MVTGAQAHQITPLVGHPVFLESVHRGFQIGPGNGNLSFPVQEIQADGVTDQPVQRQRIDGLPSGKSEGGRSRASHVQVHLHDSPMNTHGGMGFHHFFLIRLGSSGGKGHEYAFFHQKTQVDDPLHQVSPSATASKGHTLRIRSLPIPASPRQSSGGVS